MTVEYTLLFAKIIASGGKISGKSIMARNIPTHRINIARDLILQNIKLSSKITDYSIKLISRSPIT